MTPRAPSRGATLNTALGDLDVTRPAKGMEIVLYRQRELGADLVAEVAGVPPRVIEEVVVTGRAFHGGMVVMVEGDLK
jgi:hypothetical protein